MTTDNTPAMDAFLTALANLLAPKLEERMREIARDVFVDGLATHEVVTKQDAEEMIEEAFESHNEEAVHFDDDKVGEAINEALAEAFRDIARSL